MKKFTVIMLALAVLISGVFAQGAQEAPKAAVAEESELVRLAKAEGELVVYGSCEEPYIAAACDAFTAKYGIKTTFQRLSTGEVQAKIEEEKGNPSADVFFGGTTDPYNMLAAEGLLEPYAAENAVHLLDAKYKHADNMWYGIYTGLLGIFYNKDEVKRLGIAIPQDFDDLVKPEYKGLVWLSNYNTAGTAKLFLNTVIQKYGHDEAMKYLVDLDKNIRVYTKSGSGPSRNIGTGECVIGIGFLHDGVYQIVDNGYDNFGMVLPKSGTTCEIGATAIFKGAKHPNAAKLWIEFALTPDCVNLAKENGQYQFLVIDNAEQPKQAIEFGLDPNNTINYDFDDATANTPRYIQEAMTAIATAGSDTGDTRFQTK